MTTCAECVAFLSTTRLADIPANPALSSHIASCPNCSRLVTEMQYADQRLALSLDSSFPTMPPTQIAADAITASEMAHRQSVAAWFRRGLAFAAGILVVAFLRSDTGKYMIGADDFEKHSIEVNCLSRETAMALAQQYLTSRTGRVYRAENSNLVVVQGRSAEVNQAMSRIENAERTACQIPNRPQDVNPAGEKSGKD